MLFACLPCMQTHNGGEIKGKKTPNMCVRCWLRSFDQILVRIVKHSFPPFKELTIGKEPYITLSHQSISSSSSTMCVKHSYHERRSVKMREFAESCSTVFWTINFIIKLWRTWQHSPAFFLLLAQSMRLFFHEINKTLSDRYLVANTMAM